MRRLIAAFAFVLVASIPAAFDSAQAAQPERVEHGYRISQRCFKYAGWWWCIDTVAQNCRNGNGTYYRCNVHTHMWRL